MTDTLISLISIFIGIIAAYSTAFLFPKYSFDLVGNSIAGVFGSIFFIKFFGRLGFNPTAIMLAGEVNISLLFINLIVSFLGGTVALILIASFKNKLN